MKATIFDTLRYAMGLVPLVFVGAIIGLLLSMSILSVFLKSACTTPGSTLVIDGKYTITCKEKQ